MEIPAPATIAVTKLKGGTRLIDESSTSMGTIEFRQFFFFLLNSLSLLPCLSNSRGFAILRPFLIQVQRQPSAPSEIQIRNERGRETSKLSHHKTSTRRIATTIDRSMAPFVSSFFWPATTRCFPCKHRVSARRRCSVTMAPGILHTGSRSRKYASRTLLSSASRALSRPGARRRGGGEGGGAGCAFLTCRASERVLLRRARYPSVNFRPSSSSTSSSTSGRGKCRE